MSLTFIQYILTVAYGRYFSRKHCVKWA